MDNIKKIILSDLVINDTVFLPETGLQYPWEWIGNIDHFLKDIKSSQSSFENVVILDKTAFYARGGGQEPDHGDIGGQEIIDIIKHGNIVVHEIKGNVPKEGDTVSCTVDGKRRDGITKNHTSTHIINTSARSVLGSWVWQHSAFKEEDHARLDITHHSALTNDDVRVSRRIYAPTSRLRGFESGKVGPVDGTDHIGGNYVVTFNTSSTIPYILQTQESMDLKVFFDAGNIWGVDYSSSLDDSNTIRTSTGLALEWITPIGPLSFTYAEALSKASTDKTQSFKFQLGTTF